MKETELAKHFIDYFSCYDLYFEVDYGRCVDIVGINDKISIAVEVKTSFNFKVLEQAIDNCKRFNYSYIAVPDFNDKYFQAEICKDYGVGLLLLVDEFGFDINEETGKYEKVSHYKVRNYVQPKLNRHASRNKLLPFLHEFSKTSIAGSKSGDGGKITAFGITVDNLERYVERHKGCTIKEAVENISHHYGTDKAACASIYSWIKAGVIKGVRYENRKLFPVEQTKN